MMNKKLGYFASILSLALIIMMTSCDSSSKEETAEIFTLKGITMKTNDTDFLIRKIIDLHDSTMYVATPFGYDTLISIYHLKGDSLTVCRKFLTKGAGPYEMVRHGVYVYDRETKTLSCFEKTEGSLTKGYRIDMKSKTGIENKASWEIFDFKTLGHMMISDSFVYVSDTILMVTGGRYHKPELLTLINLKNIKSTVPLEFWIDDGFDSNTLVKQSVYMDYASLFKNKKLDKYLFVSGKGKYMEIFSLDNNRIINRVPLCKIYPKYGVSEYSDLNYASDPNDIHQGFRVYTTDSLIYARPMEFTIAMVRDKPTGENGYLLNCNNRIDVYDWSGKLLKIYEMDIPFDYFVVDEKNKTIYLETEDLDLKTDYIIKKYKME